MSSLASCTLLDRRKKRQTARNHAFIAALLALVFFNPWSFGLVNGLASSIFSKPNLIANQGRPTPIGLAVHALLLFIVGMFVYYSSMRPGDRPLMCCDAASLQVSVH